MNHFEAIWQCASLPPSHFVKYPLTSSFQVAARNCRKRKIDQIKQLEDEVTRIRIRKTDLIQEHEKLASQRAHWGDMVKRLHDYVLKVLAPNHAANLHFLMRD